MARHAAPVIPPLNAPVLTDDMDRFERHAAELEFQQQRRLENQGFPSGFWDSRYEQMQTYLIVRYRKMSKTWPEFQVSS